MKFSWTLLNHVIDLRNISFDYFQSKLILGGFEINNIIINDNTQDKIIEIDITSNRIDITSIIDLAQEMGSLLNLPLKIKLLKITNYINKPYIQQQLYHLKYIKITPIVHIKPYKKSLYTNKYLDIINEQNVNWLISIQKYIKIKWGYNIDFLDFQNSTIHDIYSNLHCKPYNNQSLTTLIAKHHILYKFSPDTEIDYNKIKNHSTSIILLCYLYKQDYLPYFINAYQETINLLTTYGQGTIGKSYEYYDTKARTKKNIFINFKNDDIRNILGPINNSHFEFLTIQQISQILKQLYLKPTYYKKTLQVKIPEYRAKDLIRRIDIIEEIARIHGFQFFLDKLPVTKKRGKISKNRFFTQKIRHILRYFGLHEVINCSLVGQQSSLDDRYNLYLYNPMTDEQKILRHNLIENLLSNYYYNIKQKNTHIELFEIGKIFYQNKNIIQEQMHLAGIIYNPNYTRLAWDKKAEPISWFHAKSIIENCCELLQANINWNNLNIKNSITKSFTKIEYLFDKHQQIGIYNRVNNDLIGIFGQLNYNYYKKTDKNSPIYIFELNIRKLINTINAINHLNYIIKPYSLYPSVTRDISIKLNYLDTIETIKHKILYHKKEWIESMNIINAYYDKKSKSQFLCIRIVYRAKNKTLNSIDINNIDQILLADIA
uniref:phenylalanine--tRNA ligase n=1 Tax=Bornetia secundiflora TaxID=2575637 RepID=A0A4D6WR13_9FLOR|nr:Phenylalanine-tRNA ligase beta subunit [Bornetia secundiflora]